MGSNWYAEQARQREAARQQAASSQSTPAASPPIEVARAQQGNTVPQQQPPPVAAPPPSQGPSQQPAATPRGNAPYPGTNPQAWLQQQQQQAAQSQANVPIEVARAQRGLPRPMSTPGIPDQRPDVPGYQQYPAPIGPMSGGGNLPGRPLNAAQQAEQNARDWMAQMEHTPAVITPQPGLYPGGGVKPQMPMAGGVSAAAPEGKPFGPIGGGGGGGAYPAAGGGQGGANPNEAQPMDITDTLKEALQAQPGKRYKIAPAIQKWLSDNGLYDNFLSILQALGLTDIGGLGEYGFPTDFQIPDNLADIDLTGLMDSLSPEGRTNIGMLLGSLLGLSVPPAPNNANAQQQSV